MFGTELVFVLLLAVVEGAVVVVVGGGGSDGRPSSLNFKPWAHVGQLPDAGAAGRRLLRQLRQQPPAGSEVTMWCA